MSVSLTINGVTYSYPETGDVAWGAEATDWASAVTVGMLQKAGGLFQLLSEVDFGTTYGIKSAWFKSRATNPATAGIVRLGNTEAINWANAAHDANKGLSLDASNIFQLTSALTVTGNVLATNISGTNTGDVTLATIGSSPAAAGASLSGQVLTLQPADGTYGGVVSNTTQTFVGTKNFAGAIGVAGVAGFANGSAASPSINWTADNDGSGTGLYRPSANAIGFTNNGTLSLSLSSAGVATFVNQPIFSSLTTAGPVITTSGGAISSEASLAVTRGGTGTGTYTTGDILYSDTTNSLAKLAANTTATKKFLTMTSSVPSWATEADADIPLTSAHILVGNVSNVAVDVAVSGDLTLLNTGAFTVAKIQSTVVSGTTGTTNVVFSASPTLTGTVAAAALNLSGDFAIATTLFTVAAASGNTVIGGTSLHTGVATFTAAPVFSSTSASQAMFTNGSKALVSNAISGTGSVAMTDSPTFTTALGAAAITASSTVTGLTFVPTGSSVPTNGMYLPAANSIGFGTNSAEAVRINSAGQLNAKATTDSTTSTTGALITAGGMGVAKAVNVGTTLNVTGIAAFGQASNTVAGAAINIEGTSTQGSASENGIRIAPTMNGATLSKGITIALTQSTATVANNRLIELNETTLAASGQVTNQVGVYVTDLTVGTGQNRALDLNVTSGTGRFNVYAGGTADNVLRGNTREGSTTAPTSTLDVTGTLTTSGVNTLSNLTGTGSRAVLADASGVLSAPVSDRQLKKDIIPLATQIDPLAAISALAGVFFHWDTAHPRVKNHGSLQEIGMIAQDVEAIVPQAVREDREGWKSLDYSHLVPLLVEGVKRLLTRIEILEANVKLKDKLA